MDTSICLNMIVRNEAHVIEETLACVTPHVDTWVIVDTGSTDETRQVVRSWFGKAGIEGELHERPWRDFGTNRTEALELCRGKGDYVWVIDADDLVVGELAFPDLVEDVYMLRYGRRYRYWRRQLFSNARRWRYEGPVHEYAVCCDGKCNEARVEGDYHIDSRRLGDRNRAADKYERDCKLLHEALEREPGNARNVFYLAQSYYDMGDHERSLAHYRQRASMGGWGEEVFYSLLRAAMCMERLGEPWDKVLQAYVEAHEQRPGRAEPLVSIASHYRRQGRHDLAYEYASRAASIPFPDDDTLFVFKDVYDYRARDELAIASYYTGRHGQSYELCSGILRQDLVPETERARIVSNRDFSVGHVKDATARYPEKKVREIHRRVRRRRSGPRVTLTITSCKRFELFCTTVNSFLSCCTDLDGIDRWICVDDNSEEGDREQMERLYPFFEFVWKGKDRKGHARSMNIVLDMLESPTWVHLEDDWHFFDRRAYVSDALEILGEDKRIGQVLFNRNYGEVLESRSVVGGLARTTGAGLRYRLHQHIPRGTEGYRSFFEEQPPGARSNVWWPHYSLQPSVVRTDAVRDVGRYSLRSPHFELDFATRYERNGWVSAFFDVITCLHTGGSTQERYGARNAYELNEQIQFAAAADVEASTVAGTGPAHLELWKERASQREGTCLVLERDVRPCGDFEAKLDQVLDQLEDAGAPFDMVLLGYGVLPHHDRDEVYRNDAPPILVPMDWSRYEGGAHAYLLSAAGARKLVGLVERDGIHEGVGSLLVDRKGELHVAQCLPHLVHRDPAV